MLDLNTMAKAFPMPVFKDYHIVLKRNLTSISSMTYLVMTYLTDDEEYALDHFYRDDFTIVRGNAQFKFPTKKVYYAGKLNFEDPDAVKGLDKFNLTRYLKGSGIPMVSNYDYKTHTAYSNKSKWLYHEVWKVSDLAPYVHARLDKPKKILLFDTKHIKIDGKLIKTSKQDQPTEDLD